jgi:hypothetical protein
MRSDGKWPALIGAMAFLVAGCGLGSDGVPTAPPTEMKARLIADGDSKAYDIAHCDIANSASLVAGATDQVSELLSILVSEGEGSVILANSSETPVLEGTVMSYVMGDDNLFTIEGTYLRDGAEAPFSVWGNCNAESGA